MSSDDHLRQVIDTLASLQLQITTMGTSSENNFNEIKNAQIHMNNAQTEIRLGQEEMKNSQIEMNKTQTTMQNTQNDMKNDLSKQDKRLSALETQISSLNERPAKSRKVDSGDTNMDDAQQRRPRAQDDRPHAPPPSTQQRPTDPCRVWFMGFGREILKSAMESFWNTISTTIPPDIINNTKPLIFNGRSNFSLIFPDRDAAEKFIDHCRDKNMYWKDPRDGDRKRINVKQDRSFELRLLGQVYGSIWKQMETLLKAKNKFDGVRMGTTGNRGTFTIATDDDLWTLFRVKNLNAGDSIEITASDDCAYWDITNEEANEIITTARRVALRE